MQKKRTRSGTRAPHDLKVTAVSKLLSGSAVADIAREFSVTRQSLYRWRDEEAVLDDARRLLAERVDAHTDRLREESAAPKPEPTTAPVRRGRASPIEDEDIRQRFFDGLAMGMSDRHLAGIVGVSRRTISNWRTGNGPAAEWGVEIRRAEALGVLEMHKKLHKGEPGWQAIAWILGHRWPDLYSERREVAVTGSDPVEQMSDQELDQVIGADDEEEEGW